MDTPKQQSPNQLTVRMILWTIGPAALSLVTIYPLTFVAGHNAAIGPWLLCILLSADCIGQCKAIMFTKGIGKDHPVLVRGFAVLCTFASCILLFFWAGWLAITGYYAMNSSAPPLFGGR